MSKNKKGVKVEYYPVYKPLLVIDLPEFFDALEAVANTEDFIEKKIEISRDFGWKFYELAMQIEEEQVRSYYVEVVRKWLNSSPMPEVG
jgi:hypothetical protein